MQTMSNNELVQVTDEVAARQLLAVFEYRVNHGGSVAQACDALGYNYRTMLTWLGEGKLRSVLDSTNLPALELSRVVALESLPVITQNMAEIAAGKKVVRGVSPVAAAQFVLDMARLAIAEQSKTSNRTFIPVAIPYVDAEK